MFAIERDRGVGNLGPGAIGSVPLKPQDGLGIADGQRTQGHHVERRERRDRGADADGENEDRGRGKSGRRTHRPERVTQILAEAVEPHETPGFAGVLAQAQGIAQGHTPALFSHFAVKGHLLRQFVVEAAAIEKVVDAAQEFSQELLPFTLSAGWPGWLWSADRIGTPPPRVASCRFASACRSGPCGLSPRCPRPR